jgi:hypothetical protein
MKKPIPKSEIVGTYQSLYIQLREVAEDLTEVWGEVSDSNLTEVEKIYKKSLVNLIKEMAKDRIKVEEKN